MIQEPIDIWKQMPYFNKRFIIISIFIYLLSFLTPIPTILLINIPAVTINQYQPHRLFTTIFININIFQFIFGIISLLPITIDIEKSKGSIYFLFQIMYYAFAVQTTYCLILYIVNLFYGILAMSFPSSGFWSLIMLYHTITCYNNPNQQKPLLCFLYQIKSKYYPFILLLFLSFFNLQIDLFVSFIVGFISIYKPFDLLQENIENLESSSFFQYLSQANDFILLQNAKSSGYIVFNRNHINRTKINLPITNQSQEQGVLIGNIKQEVLQKENYQTLDS